MLNLEGKKWGNCRDSGNENFVFIQSWPWEIKMWKRRQALFSCLIRKEECKHAVTGTWTVKLSDKCHVLKFTYIQFTWSKETEEIMNTCVSFFRAALGLGGQQAVKTATLNMFNEDIRLLVFFFITGSSNTVSDFQKHLSVNVLSFFFFF